MTPNGFELDGRRAIVTGASHGIGAADEIAALVHHPVAPVGRFATGTSFRVDGGTLALGPFDSWRSAGTSE